VRGFSASSARAASAACVGCGYARFKSRKADLSAPLNSKAGEFYRLKPGLMAAGAFLLALGVTFIPAGASLVVSFGLAQNSNNTSLLTTIGVVLASVGAGLLAYGVGAKPKEGNPMPSQ